MGLRAWYRRTLTMDGAMLEREYRACPTHSVYVQVGAGRNVLPGWINTDLVHRLAVFELDATRQWPFDGASVDLVFSEQFIEHLTFREGHRFLTYAFHVLRPGGIIRTTTVSLDALVREYVARSELAREMQRRNAIHGYVAYGEELSSLLNKAFYADGHRHLYDFDTLRWSLADVGFVDVTPETVGVSRHDALRSVEQHAVGTIHDQFCLVLEATKPSRAPG